MYVFSNARLVLVQFREKSHVSWVGVSSAAEQQVQTYQDPFFYDKERKIQFDFLTQLYLIFTPWRRTNSETVSNGPTLIHTWNQTSQLIALVDSDVLDVQQNVTSRWKRVKKYVNGVKLIRLN